MFSIFFSSLSTWKYSFEVIIYYLSYFLFKYHTPTALCLCLQVQSESWRIPSDLKTQTYPQLKKFSHTFSLLLNLFSFLLWGPNFLDKFFWMAQRWLCFSSWFLCLYFCSVFVVCLAFIFCKLIMWVTRLATFSLIHLLNI